MVAVDVAYSVEGSGPPLYMVHGIGSRRATWDALVEDLKSDFTCVSYDLRGHGESPVGELPYDLDCLIEDLEALRAKLGHDKIHVIGHSLGGMIGPGYALAHPERTLTVGLLSTAAGRTEDDSAKVMGVVRAMEEKGIEPVFDTLLDRWFTDDFIAARPDVITRRKEQVMTTPAEVFLSVFHVYAETEMAPWLHKVTHPCLVLTGELDGGCNPRLNRFIADELPDSELVILDGIKHAILLEAPERVIPPVRDFLARRG